MTEAELPGLVARVLGAAFALGVVFGAIGQRTAFCTMGAVADIVNIGDWGRMRMWALAAGVAIVGFNAMAALGWVRAADTIYAAPQLLWLSSLVGGAMFGVGMVLASGCGSKTLIRVGGGNLKSLVVFVVLGVSAWATLRGVTAIARTASVDRVRAQLPSGQDLPTLAAGALGIAPSTAALALGLALGGGLVAWSLARREGRSGDVLLGGLGIGLAVVALWWVSGVLGHVDEHPQTLEPAFVATNSRRMESFSFVAPVAYTLEALVFATDASRTLTVGIAIVCGVVVGSAAAALASRTFRWEGFRDAGDTASHLVGAVLMGVGGITASGCTIGQGLSGLSTLALGSALALAGILIGAVAGLRWQAWRIERQL